MPTSFPWGTLYGFPRIVSLLRHADWDSSTQNIFISSINSDTYSSASDSDTRSCSQSIFPKGVRFLTLTRKTGGCRHKKRWSYSKNIDNQNATNPKHRDDKKLFRPTWIWCKKAKRIQFASYGEFSLFIPGCSRRLQQLSIFYEETRQYNSLPLDVRQCKTYKAFNKTKILGCCERALQRLQPLRILGLPSTQEGCLMAFWLILKRFRSSSILQRSSHPMKPTRSPQPRPKR
jgi:hypothetical protein